MNRREFGKFAGAGLVATGGTFARSARAQTAYPSSPIRLIVPYAPGGVVDAVARNWADKVREPLGTIAVENQGGGGGTIGAAAVSRAKADGYTLLFGDTSCEVIAPSLLLHPSYDPSKDFTPVSLVATSSTAIVVHRSVPATTLSEFIAYAKEHQDKLSYASAGTGTVTHLAGESFKQLIGAPKILHVPYRGAGPGLIDLIAGVVPMMTPNVTGQVLGFHKAGKLRILAVCAPARLKAVPDIPAAGETLPGLVLQLTCGVFGPARLPQAIVTKLSEATGHAVRQPEFERILQGAGLEARTDTGPEAAQSFWAAERDHLLPIIKAAGLKPE
jgi:tripartite-type tricarboxylate transporter receptor subunit TctC